MNYHNSKKKRRPQQQQKCFANNTNKHTFHTVCTVAQPIHFDSTAQMCFFSISVDIFSLFALDALNRKLIKFNGSQNLNGNFGLAFFSFSVWFPPRAFPIRSMFRFDRFHYALFNHSHISIIFIRTHTFGPQDDRFYFVYFSNFSLPLEFHIAQRRMINEREKKKKHDTFAD